MGMDDLITLDFRQRYMSPLSFQESYCSWKQQVSLQALGMEVMFAP